jgi:hypothetical protein
MSDYEIPADNYIAHITDTTTGETRAVRMDYPFGDGSYYWWREGNASCDCNRGAWFYGRGGLERHPCGDGRYRVRCVDDAGNVLYEDRVAFDIHPRDV